jgi:tetratricopeptide (TPR) repeat protein
VAISELTRKILWIESGGRCALCRRQLLTPGTATDAPSVFGEEAHIVGKAPNGPRSGGLPDAHVDDHSNLIILCSEHHKQVDDQRREYTDARLREIKDHHRRWIAQLGESDRTPPSVQVSEADPFRLGVHRAIHVPGTAQDSLPAYIERDTDLDPHHGVRALLADARRRGGFVLVIGGSSTGKTRCLLEAVRDVLPNRPLIHPTSSSEVRDLARSCALPIVVWLDELHRYLREGDALDAGVIRRLVEGDHPAVIVGTLWPSDQTEFTQRPAPGAPDLRERERAVIELAARITLPERLTPTELTRAEQSDDPRVQTVLQTKEFGFAQSMAAAPELLERWEHADPYARAVISAALDVARLGVRSPIPATVLRTAAPGYCDGRVRARADRQTWFDRALEYATSELKGAASVLIPIDQTGHMGEPCGYQIADYLLDTLGCDRLSASIPETLWTACRDLDLADARTIGRAAEKRLRYEPAARLYERACQDITDTKAAGWLARFYRNAGRYDDAADILGPTCQVHYENPMVYVTLGNSLVLNMADAGEISWLAERADAGDYIAAERLSSLLEEAGDEETLQARTEAGDPYAADRLAAFWLDQGRRAEAIVLLENLAAAGAEDAAYRLADVYTDQGQPAEAIRVLFPAADAGDVFAQHRLGQLLAEAGRTSEACSVLHRLVKEDDPSAIEAWVDIIANDDFERTLDFLQEAAQSGNASAAQQLARLLVSIDRRDEAVEVLRTADGGSAQHQLFDLLTDAGRHGDALVIAQEMIEAGHPTGVQATAEALAALGSHAELSHLAHAGIGEAAAALARIWVTEGKELEAMTLLQSAATNGSFAALHAWITHLANVGRADDAKRLRSYGLTADGQIATKLELPKTHVGRRAAAANRFLASGKRPQSTAISPMELLEDVKLAGVLGGFSQQLPEN